MERPSSSSAVYQPMSDEVREANKDIPGLQRGTEFSNTFVASFLKQHAPGKFVKEDLGTEFKYKQYFLANKRKEKKFNRQPGKRKTLTAIERKELKLFVIQPQQQKYSMYIPLHKLWKDYICDVIRFDKIKEENKIQTESKLLRADYHGAIITVTRSKCPSLIGITGIVVQEMKNTFKIITKDDKLKTLPKPNSVFSVVVKGFLFTIYGNQFCVRPSDRVTKKFKSKPTVDL